MSVETLRALLQPPELTRTDFALLTGTEVEFVVPAVPLMVYRNGLLQREDIDYSVVMVDSSARVRFEPFAPAIGDLISVIHLEPSP
jgi:hypothetical protein